VSWLIRRDTGKEGRRRQRKALKEKEGATKMSSDYDYGSDGDEEMASSSDDNDYGFDNGADVYAAQPKVRSVCGGTRDEFG
jgi:hypothetical protein